MAIKVLMPALSPTMSEGVINKWLVNIGDTVSANISPAETVSPILTNHLLITPSDIVGDNAGIKTLIAIYLI